MVSPSKRRNLLVLWAVFASSALAAGYTDPKGRFALDAPEGWKVQAAPDGTSVVFVTADDVARMIVLPLEVPETASLGEVAAAYEHFLGQAAPNSRLKLEKEAQVRVAGLPAVRREYVVEEGGNAAGRVVTTFVKAGKLSLTLHTSARGAEFDKYAPTFTQCLGSLRLSSAAAAPEPTGDIQAKLDALEAAHRAGVLSAEEYARKRASLEAQVKPAAPQMDAATRQKLDALEAAHKAGVLTDEEFAQKKALILQSAAPQLDEATKKKLEALQAAHLAGILSDAEYERKRAELTGGAEQPARPAQPAAAPPIVTAKKGKVYRHAIGFSFWYPEGWAIREQEGFLQLTPPNPGQKDGSPTELYFVTGESVAGENITGPSDPRVAEYFDTQVRTLTPALQRVGGAEQVPMAKGSGAGLHWEAKGAAGDIVRAKAYVAIIGDNGVALVAIGLKERLDVRDAECRQMFASFGFGEGEKDAALVGNWHLTSTSALTNQSPFETDWSRARMAADRTSSLALRPDGTWTRRDSYHMLVGAGGTWLEDKNEKSTEGRWNTSNGMLYLMGKDDTWDEYKYQIRQASGGRQLVLVSAKNAQLWSEAR